MNITKSSVAKLFAFSVSTDPTESTCLEKYRQAMENYNIGRFVPQCKPDGRYEEVQCGAGWDYCWCVDSTGTELSGTKIKGWPQCGKINIYGNSLTFFARWRIAYVLYREYFPRLKT